MIAGYGPFNGSISMVPIWALSTVSIRSAAASLCFKRARCNPTTTSWTSFIISHPPQTMSGICVSARSCPLLILLMEDAWDDTQLQATPDILDIQTIKNYLDENFKRRISLDDLASSFYLNKYYLMKLFKDRYGMTINAYLNQARMTWVKQQLRFTDKTVEALAAELQIEPAYLSRLFKNIEGVSPTSFRKNWGGR